MFCDKCGYAIDSFDKECRRCHGTGSNVSAPATSQPNTTGKTTAFDFTDELTVDEDKLRLKAKQKRIANRIVTFLVMFMLTQYGFSLYQRRAFERELLAHYNQELRDTGSTTSCSRAELRGFGLFATTSASGYIYCSDGIQRRASWTRDSSGKAEWNVEETGQRE